MTERIQFYGDSISGNCYKLQLACSELEIEYDWHEMDILAGDTRTEKFLAMNTNGKVPLMVLQDGRCLPESNAILSYLADGSGLAGDGRFTKANVMQWLFFEQYSHEPYIATARFIAKYLGLPEDRRAEYEAKQAGGQAALEVLENHLAAHDFLVGDQFTIADITLYAYTHVADEGGFDLSEYPAVQRWLVRVSDQPAHTTMNDPV